MRRVFRELRPSYDDRFFILNVQSLRVRTEVTDVICVYELQHSGLHVNPLAVGIEPSKLPAHGCDINLLVKRATNCNIKKSFSYRMPSAQNKLPTDIKRVQSEHIFKSKFEAYFGHFEWITLILLSPFILLYSMCVQAYRWWCQSRMCTLTSLQILFLFYFYFE